MRFLEGESVARGGTAVFLAALGFGAPAKAEPITYDAEARLVVLGGGFAQDADFDEEPAVARLTATVSAEKVFANGVEVRVVLGGAGERDHPRRDPRGGVASDCPPSNPACPSFEGQSLRGFISGFTPSGTLDDQTIRGSLEQAYLLVRGGYGELSVGRDEGAASRFSLSPPSVLPAGDLLQPSIDLTGFSGVVTRNDVSGQSFKVAVVTPRILGLRLGASWTPASEAQGVDQQFERGPGQPLTANPRNLAEFGASYERTWRNGIKARFSGTYASGGDATGLAAFDRLESWSYGAGLGRGRWSFGVQRVGADNAWAGEERGYRATAASIVRNGEDFGVMLGGGQARDNLAGVRISTVTLGSQWNLTNRLGLFTGVTGAQRQVLQSRDGTMAAARLEREQTVGGFLGFSFRV